MIIDSFEFASDDIILMVVCEMCELYVLFCVLVMLCCFVLVMLCSVIVDVLIDIED